MTKLSSGLSSGLPSGSSSGLPPRLPRTRAPELAGRGWLNTDGPLRLADLRGRFVLLDFWTFCCINCLHVIDELRPVEEAHADELVVIGVHSPKFVHEADPDALALAVRRHRVEHPVLDDPELRTWQAYTARAWPTLVLIDPEGYVIAQYAGEGHGHAVDALITELAPAYQIGSCAPRRALPRPQAHDLAFPAKAVRLPDGSILVADTGNDRLSLLTEPLTTVLEGGLREPNGLCLLPPELAAEVRYDVVVADTGNHRLAGWNSRVPGAAAITVSSALNSPWDVVWWRDRVWVAMAGDHTLHTFDPRTGVSERVGGTTNEGLVDGPIAEAWFAQPSGLAADGDRLWIADAETSALRWIEEGPDGLAVHTAIGEGLFDFGFHDGDRSEARMQHPLGVTVYDGRVLVADTYNGAIRSYDPDTGVLSTVARGLAEPSGFVLAPPVVELVETRGLLVVESAAHRLSPLVIEEEMVEGPVSQTRRPPTDLATTATLRVSFTAPPGQKVDERFGPAVQLHVSSTPAALLRAGEGVDTSLERRLVLDPRVGEGVLHIAARAATCDVGGGEGAACRLHQQDWGIPITVGESGAAELVLPLGGVG